MNKYVSLAAIAAALALGTSAAHALTATANLTVKAQVTTACSIAASTLDFGTVLTSATATTTTYATIGITCSVPYQLSLDNGQHYDNVRSKRRVQTGSDTAPVNYMGYALNDQDGIPWDNGAITNPPVQSLTVFGVLDAPIEGQVQGTYTDTVAMTLTY
jgi:spore coat protein U-like protein